jgi:septal ring factor EnvC (AmiA/AmiB activator)
MTAPDGAETGRWRTGRKVGRTLYIGDVLVGVMDTRELAEKVVVAVNAAQLARPVLTEWWTRHHNEQTEEIERLRAENATLREDQVSYEKDQEALTRALQEARADRDRLCAVLERKDRGWSLALDELEKADQENRSLRAELNAQCENFIDPAELEAAHAQLRRQAVELADLRTGRVLLGSTGWECQHGQPPRSCRLCAGIRERQPFASVSDRQPLPAHPTTWTHPRDEQCVHCASEDRLASTDPVIDCPREECPDT